MKQTMTQDARHMLHGFKVSHAMQCLVFCAWSVMMCVCGSSCTRNGGDIGIWFGTWAVESHTVDGNDAVKSDAAAAYYLQFQRTVVCLRHTDALHNGGESYGLWNEEDGTMTITFDPKNYDVTIMPQSATYTVTCTDNRHVTLTATDAEGHKLTYNLAKR